MSFSMRLEGVEDVLEALNVDIPEQLGVIIDQALIKGEKAAEAHTPVVTGAMQAAWRSQRTELVGVLGIDSSAFNSVSGVLVSEYAPLVDERHGILDQVVVSIWPLTGVKIRF